MRVPGGGFFARNKLDSQRSTQSTTGGRSFIEAQTTAFAFGRFLGWEMASGLDLIRQRTLLDRTGIAQGLCRPFGVLVDAYPGGTLGVEPPQGADLRPPQLGLGTIPTGVRRTLIVARPCVAGSSARNTWRLPAASRLTRNVLAIVQKLFKLAV